MIYIITAIVFMFLGAILRFNFHATKTDRELWHDYAASAGQGIAEDYQTPPEHFAKRACGFADAMLEMENKRWGTPRHTHTSTHI